MDFSAPLWLFPLIAAPGLWLAARLYPVPAPSRRVLAWAASAAWLLLALFTLSPRLKSRPEIWHPPRVVLAVDESPSYAALGARDSATRAMGAARRHYEALGFRVVEAGFAERVVGDGGPRDAGVLTSLSALRRHLDAAAFPNLQAVLLWTDGRFFEDAETVAGMADAAEDWPAPVFPVPVPPVGGEVQGERAVADFAEPEGATLEVEWRAIGEDPSDAALELRDRGAGGRLLWTAPLPHPPGIPAGERVAARLRLPPEFSQAAVDAGEDALFLILRPAARGANAVGKNDTVPLRVRGAGRSRHVFARPPVSLEERGLIDALRGDALRESGTRRVTVLSPASSPSSAIPGRGDILWVRDGADSRAAGAEVPRMVYRFSESESGNEGKKAAAGVRAGFGADARVGWRSDGAEFLPAEVLRLADLGAERMTLRGPDSSLEALAWAEEDGRRGLLFWRDRADGSFGFAVPPLWRAGFRPAAPSRARATAARWTLAAAEWAAARGAARVMPPRDPLAGRPFSVAARLPFQADDASDAAGDGSASPPRVFAHPFGERRGVVTGPGGLRFDSIALPAGTHAVALHASLQGGRETLWRGALRVRSAGDAELSRLGTDPDALRGLAARSRGDIVSTIHDDHGIAFAWPVLPGGQARETRARVHGITPPALTALLIAALLSVVWALRKRLRLD